MKRNIKRLILICLGYYLLVDPLREILLKGFSSTYLDGTFDLFYLMITTFTSFAFYSICAYIAFFYFFKKSQWYYILLIVICGFFLSAVFRYLSQQVLSEALWGFVNYRRDIDLGFYFRDQFYYAIIYFTIGIVYFNIQYGLYKDKREKDLLLTNQKMELSLLRAQINPHFLLNSMNNIYSLVSMNSEKSLPAIDKLSSILKYTLYENREMVTLQEERDYLENYIALQSLRYPYKPAIKLDFQKESLIKELPQFILVPLIENAFKHGNLKNEERPLIIESSISGGMLRLKVSNEKGTHFKDNQGGIGLDNIQKRLQLIYGESHNFTKKETEEIFEIIINFPVQ